MSLVQATYVGYDFQTYKQNIYITTSGVSWLNTLVEYLTALLQYIDT